MQAELERGKSECTAVIAWVTYMPSELRAVGGALRCTIETVGTPMGVVPNLVAKRLLREWRESTITPPRKRL